MTSERIEIRRAGDADVDGMVALLESIADEGRWIATETPLDRESRAKNVRAALAREDAALFVAVDGTNVVGRAGVYSQWPGLYDLGMFVAAPWRSKGLGSRLLEAVIAWARAAGAHKITLDVFPSNEAAIALYEKSGFVREGYHPKQLRRKTGELWDVISMGLLL